MHPACTLRAPCVHPACTLRAPCMHPACTLRTDAARTVLCCIGPALGWCVSLCSSPSPASSRPTLSEHHHAAFRLQPSSRASGASLDRYHPSSAGGRCPASWTSEVSAAAESRTRQPGSTAEVAGAHRRGRPAAEGGEVARCGARGLRLLRGPCCAPGCWRRALWLQRSHGVLAAPPEHPAHSCVRGHSPHYEAYD